MSDMLSKLQRQTATAEVDPNWPENYHLILLAQQKLVLERVERKIFDSTHPVDEYAYLPSPNFQAAGSPVTWQPDYEQEVRIESISWSLPIGITAADLQLGQRHIPLLQAGAATTVQTVSFMNGLGIILNRSDARILTFTGTPSSGHYIALAGFLLERHGNL